MDAPPIRFAKTSDGHTLAYAISGSGLPLLCMPVSFSHFSRFWNTNIGRQYKALADRFRLIQYDGRGQGSSSRGLADTTSMADFQVDLETVIEAAGLQRFFLYGPSVFGRIALRYAAQNPERVIGLILWNYSEMTRLPHSEAFRELANQDWEFFTLTIARTGFANLETRVATDVVRGALTQSDWIRQALAFRTEGDEGTIGKIAVPVLLLATRSGLLSLPTEKAARNLIAKLPGVSRLILFDHVLAGMHAEGDEVPPAVLAIEAFVQDISPEAPESSSDHSLSERELEVLRLIAEGKANQEIADALTISLNTVRHHVTHIFDKIGVANRTEASSYAHRHRIVG